MLRLAAPILMEQVLAMAVGLNDRLLAGHFLETPHLAAMNLMAYLLWLMQGTFSMVGIGATAMIARFFGAKDYDSAARVTNQAFVVGAALAVVVALAGMLFARPLVLLLQLEGESADLATTYLLIVLPIVPLVMAEVVGIACLRAAGDMVAGLVIMAIVNVVNVAVSWTLVVGLGPAPELGWKGLAIGTTCGFAVGGLLVTGLLAAGRSGLRLRWRLLRPDFGLIRRLLKVGLRGGADMLSVIGCQLWFVSLVNRLGTLAAAAHGVAIGIESVAFLPGFAFQTAAATLAGQYLGAGEYRKASRSVLMACLVGSGIMITAGATFYYFSDSLPYLFVSADQADVAMLTSPLLRTVAVAMPALAVTMILSGALRGAGDTRWPLIFSLIGFLGIRLPGACWLAFESIHIPLLDVTIPGWNLGVVGAWYAMLVDLSVRSVLVVYRFFHGGWKRIDV